MNVCSSATNSFASYKAENAHGEMCLQDSTEFEKNRATIEVIDILTDACVTAFGDVHMRPCIELIHRA